MEFLHLGPYSLNARFGDGSFLEWLLERVEKVPRTGYLNFAPPLFSRSRDSRLELEVPMKDDRKS
jgi:hypothetical protein